jgi:hypothetical protein
VGLRGERPLAPDAVDRAVPGRRRQPGAGVGRSALPRPPRGCDRERLLGGILGEVEVAEKADQVRDDTTPLVAEDVVRQRSTNGRTSTAPPLRAAGMAAANSSASSRLGTSIR